MERTIKAKRGWYEFDYFRPDAKNLLHPFFRDSLALYLFLMGTGFVLSVIVFNVLAAPLLFFIPSVMRKARAHDLQVRYMSSGVVPPQDGSIFGKDEERYWDSVEQRHRYRDNGWQ